MSQGVGTYIRGLKEEAENKIPVHMRKLTEKVLQVLAAECGKVRLGNRLLFDFSTERDGKAFFCSACTDSFISFFRHSFRVYSEGGCLA